MIGGRTSTPARLAYRYTAAVLLALPARSHPVSLLGSYASSGSRGVHAQADRSPSRSRLPSSPSSAPTSRRSARARLDRSAPAARRGHRRARRSAAPLSAPAADPRAPRPRRPPAPSQLASPKPPFNPSARTPPAPGDSRNAPHAPNSARRPPDPVPLAPAYPALRVPIDRARRSLRFY